MIREEEIDQLAWHYTIGKNAERIMDCGLILPATLHVPPTEIPVVWFSIAKAWEPTATAMITKSGITRRATMEEMRYEAGGLARFGLPRSALLPWRDLKLAANIDPKDARKLAKVARKQGANPSHWYGSLTDVAVKDCTVQFERSPGTWG